MVIRYEVFAKFGKMPRGRSGTSRADAQVGVGGGDKGAWYYESHAGGAALET